MKSAAVAPLPLTTIMRHPFASKRCILVFRDTGEEIKEVFELPTQYEAIAPIGQGTFGFVCSARDNDKVNEFKLNPPEECADNDLTIEEKNELYDAYTLVAIKKLRQLFENNQPRMWLCATREIQLMMSFQHENVMSAIDFFIPLGGAETMTYDFIRDLRETFDSVYVVMKKMDYTLREVLDSCTLTVADAKEFAQSIELAPCINETEYCEQHIEYTIDCNGNVSTSINSDVISSPISHDNINNIGSSNSTCCNDNNNNNKNSNSNCCNCCCCETNSPNHGSLASLLSENATSNCMETDENNGKESELTINVDKSNDAASSSNNFTANAVDVDNTDNCQNGTINANVNNTNSNTNNVVETSCNANELNKIAETSSEELLRCPCSGLVLHPLSRDYRKFVLYQIFRGVGYLHLCPVIHRDLKPENIMLDRSYNTCITDFGQGRQIDVNESEYAATVLDTCTQWYAAPETLSPIASSAMGFIDHATFHGVDVWSIGCIAAEMLMGKPLFYRSSLGGLMHLRTIINVLGTPTEEDIQSIAELREKTNSEIFLLAVKKALKTCSACTPQLREMLKSPYCDEDEDEIDLICNCLTWNPHKRIRIQAALDSPYFVKDGYDSVIDPEDANKRVPSVRPSDISEPVSGRAFLWDLFVQRHPEVQELWESLERRHHSTSSVDVIFDEANELEENEHIITKTVMTTDGGDDGGSNDFIDNDENNNKPCVFIVENGCSSSSNDRRIINDNSNAVIQNGLNNNNNSSSNNNWSEPADTLTL